MATAEVRRLNRILYSEEYGEKLVRLPKANQRVVLDLIERGETRSAKAEILSFTERRLAARRERAAAKRAGVPAPPRLSWSNAAQVMEGLAAAAYPDRAYSRAQYVRTAQAHGDAEDLQHVQHLMSSQPAMMAEAHAAAKAGYVWSPFWYHYWS